MMVEPKPLTKKDVELVDTVALDPETTKRQSLTRVIREYKVLVAVQWREKRFRERLKKYLKDDRISKVDVLMLSGEVTDEVFRIK